MARRSRIGGSYVTRSKRGRFKTWSSVGKSISADKRQKAKKKPKKSGYGHIGDY